MELTTYVYCEYCSWPFAVQEKQYPKHLLEIHKISRPCESLPGNRFNVRNLEKFLSNTKQWWQQNVQWSATVWNNGARKSITWKHIIFDEGSIRFSDSVGSNIQSYPFSGSIKYLNLIKDEYFERTYPFERFRLLFYQGKLQPRHSPDLHRLLRTIKEGKIYLEHHPVIRQKPRVLELADERPFSASAHNVIDRIPHLKVLSTFQIKGEALITIKEAIGTTTEDAFIFKAKTLSGKFLIIWENVNESRACHIFLASDKSEATLITQRLSSFIKRTDLTRKRELLWGRKNGDTNFQAYLHYFKSIKHTGRGVRSFEGKIKWLIKSN